MAKYPTFKEALEAEILSPLGDAASDYDIEALAEALLIDVTVLMHLLVLGAF